MVRRLIGIGMVLTAALHPARAEAGAWLAPPEGQNITTASAGSRGGVAVFESSGYWEGPIADDVTIVAAPWSETAPDLESGWRGEMVFGVKRAIFRDDRRVMALQTSLYWRSDPPGDCGEGGIETRWLGGRSVGDTGFVNLELAGRVLDEGCPAARVNFSFGYRPQPNWLAMGEIFYDAPREGDESLKLQVSVVRFDENGRGIQVGLRTRLDGGGEAALVLGWWGRGGD